MFTGIVQTQASLAHKQGHDHFVSFRFNVGTQYLDKVETGASIAINGVCLTVTAFDVGQGWVDFDVIDETLKLTNLGKLQIGQTVNFERSLVFGKEIGGHILSGHIQTQANIKTITRTADNCAMLLDIQDKSWSKYILGKGFIAVDGASLTVGESNNGEFWLHLIPETLRITRMDGLREGDSVNIEVDHQTQVIVQTVERVLAERQ